MLSACVVTSSPSGEQPITSASVPGSELDKITIVTCLLPGQIRKLGGQFTYLTARRPIKTTASDCEIRGGEYVAFDRSDYATALKTLLPEAQAGKPTAQTYVGEIYEKGLGLAAPDYAQAAQWYRKAADQGYASAQTNLGFLYEKGLGVPKDSTAALNWYRKASGLTDDQLTFESSLEAERQAFREEINLRKRVIASLRGQLQNTRQQLEARNRSLQAVQQQIREVRSKLQRLQSAPPTPSNSAEIQTLQRHNQKLEAQSKQHSQQLTEVQKQFEQRQAQLTAQLRDAQSESENYKKAAQGNQQLVIALLEQRPKAQSPAEAEALNKKLTQLEKLQATRKEQSDQIYQVAQR
jgi:predicted  nucleic acid-binding Zn-ribbon protein